MQAVTLTQPGQTHHTTPHGDKAIVLRQAEVTGRVNVEIVLTKPSGPTV